MVMHRGSAAGNAVAPPLDGARAAHGHASHRTVYTVHGIELALPGIPLIQVGLEELVDGPGDRGARHLEQHPSVQALQMTGARVRAVA